LVLIDCALFSSRSNFGFQQFVLHFIYSFMNGDKCEQPKLWFIFKSSERKFLVDTFGDEILKHVLFVKPRFWRWRIQYLVYRYNKYNLTVVNTYNQSLYLAPRLKVVTIVHDHQFKTVFHPIGFRKLFYNFMFTFFAANKYIAISKTTMYEQIKFYGSHNDCFYIYNPVNLNFYENIERVHLKCNKYFLFVGSDKPYKNLKYLIKEYEKVYELDNSHELVCVGGCRVPSTAPVHYLSNITQENLNYLYLNCEAVVVPSLYEGYCYPFIEAKLFNKPVVAYDMPISREILDNRNDHFIHGKDDELAKILIKLINSKVHNYMDSKVQNLCLSSNYFEQLLNILGE